MNSNARIALMTALAIALHGGVGFADHCHSGHGSARVSRSIATYELPSVELHDQTGATLSLEQALSTERPLAVNFIFTTCTTICPVMTATFAKLRRELGPEAAELEMVSISIDPEYDTPSVLADYAERFSAGERWRFLTGSADDVAEVLEAFDALDGSKMSHRPFTLFRMPGSESWIRVDGMASAAELAAEFRQLRVASR